MDPLLQLAALQFPLHSPVYSDLFLVSVLRKLRFLNFSCLWHLYNCSFVTGASPQGKTVGEKKEEIITGIPFVLFGLQEPLFWLFLAREMGFI